MVGFDARQNFKTDSWTSSGRSKKVIWRERKPCSLRWWLGVEKREVRSTNWRCSLQLYTSGGLAIACPCNERMTYWHISGPFNPEFWGREIAISSGGGGKEHKAKTELIKTLEAWIVRDSSFVEALDMHISIQSFYIFVDPWFELLSMTRWFYFMRESLPSSNLAVAVALFLFFPLDPFILFFFFPRTPFFFQLEVNAEEARENHLLCQIALKNPW